MRNSNRHLPPAEAQPDLIPDPFDLVREYCRLAVQRPLSDADMNRLEQILTLAESDGLLDFWINEADHFLAHELALTDESSIHACENQQAMLREHLACKIPAMNTDSQLFQELKQRLQTSSKELQLHLKSRGFDPGPIDGQLGPRTHSALVDFQKAHQLDADGVPNASTRDALGLS